MRTEINSNFLFRLKGNISKYLDTVFSQQTFLEKKSMINSLPTLIVSSALLLLHFFLKKVEHCHKNQVTIYKLILWRPATKDLARYHSPTPTHPAIARERKPRRGFRL